MVARVRRFSGMGGTVRVAQAAAVVAAVLVGWPGQGARALGGMPASDALEMLRQGNTRFVAGTAMNPNTNMTRVSETSKEQRPFAMVMTCSDSRLPVERLFDRGVGDIFVVRLAGNVADTNAVGSIEYGAEHLGSQLLVVMGHSKCGAVAAACKKTELHGSIPGLISTIMPAVDAAVAKHPGVTGDALVPFAVEENVWQSVAQVVGSSAELQERIRNKKLQVVGAVYNVETGKVNVLGEHPEQGKILAAGVVPLRAVGGQGEAQVRATAEAAKPEQAKPVQTKQASAPSEKSETVLQKVVPSEPKVAVQAMPVQVPTSEVPANPSAIGNVVSSGEFATPGLALVKRPAFGAASGKADVIEQPAAAERESMVLVWTLSGLAGLALVFTVMFAALQARSVTPTGTRWSLTIGSKLALGFGGLTSALLLVCLFAADAQRSLNTIRAEGEETTGREVALQTLRTDAMTVRLAMRKFLMSESDENLKDYSDRAATAVARAANLLKMMGNDSLAQDVADFTGMLGSYDQLLQKVVPIVDERSAVVDMQIGPTSARANDVLLAISATARAEGDDRAATLSLELNDRLQQARMYFFKYLRSGNADDAGASAESLKRGIASMDETMRMVSNPRVKGAFGEVKQAFEFFAERVDKAASLAAARDELVKTELEKLGPSMLAKGKSIDEAMRARKQQLDVRAKAAATSVRTQMGVVSGVAALFGILAGLGLARNITGGARRVLNVLRAVAEGDLTQPPINSTSKDELGELARATDKMATSLRDVIAEVSASTVDVAGAATQIAASAEEMSASVGEVARQATKASETAAAAGKMAHDGGEVVFRTIQGMHAIDEAVSASAQSVGELGKRGEEIGQVISVINEIADQTNLLALNAAIEAARAGENGRGFGVVADEIRKLAERTTRATEEVGGSIKSIQQETKLAVERMGRGTEQVKTGVELAAQAGENLRQIVDGAAQVAGMIQSISAATDEAGAGSAQSASAATHLSVKAEQLMTMVQRFKVQQAGAFVSKAAGGVRMPAKSAA